MLVTDSLWHLPKWQQYQHLELHRLTGSNVRACAWCYCTYIQNARASYHTGMAGDICMLSLSTGACSHICMSPVIGVSESGLHALPRTPATVPGTRQNILEYYIFSSWLYRKLFTSRNFYSQCQDCAGRHVEGCCYSHCVHQTGLHV